MKSLKALVPTAAATAALALTLAACGASGGDADPTGASSSDAGDTRGGTLTLGILQEPASWDPAQAHVGHHLQPFQAAYDTLILREPDGSLAPMLATDWQYTDETNT
ncbi:MAG: ABC transporter substrate-binding protein, partial [Actinomycetes bacterium]|nr:ABC transporter substrate-binding protein [Actinomycetes bacterium]MDX5449504.1 ABC transporter substrate-binding protein [Actinomycetes bacterium]